jgi:hypothetical protein
MYDKFGRVLRLETVTNDVSFFKHHREVVHRDGSFELKLAAVKKSIYTLPALAELLQASNRRYLEFLSSLTTVVQGHDASITSVAPFGKARAAIAASTFSIQRTAPCSKRSCSCW